MLQQPLRNPTPRQAFELEATEFKPVHSNSFDCAYISAYDRAAEIYLQSKWVHAMPCIDFETLVNQHKALQLPALTASTSQQPAKLSNQHKALQSHHFYCTCMQAACKPFKQLQTCNLNSTAVVRACRRPADTAGGRAAQGAGAGGARVARKARAAGQGGGARVDAVLSCQPRVARCLPGPAALRCI